MSQAANTIAFPRDLGKERGLSPETLRRFNVRNERDYWHYDSRTDSGAVYTRAKAYDKAVTGKKYYSPHGQPADAVYLYPVGEDIRAAVVDAWGTVYMVGGDIAAMTMLEAGMNNTLSFFGDKVPGNLLDLLTSLGVSAVRVFGDRDKSGEAWCCEIRDALKDQLTISVIFHALPYPVEEKGGKDVNNFWLGSNRDGKAFQDALLSLPEWHLPEPEPVESRDFTDAELGSDSLPADFIRDIESALGVSGQTVNDKGYTRNFKCPFHDDAVPSAAWNREGKFIQCQAASCGNHNAKQVGEHFNIYLRDYLDSTPTLKTTIVGGVEVAQAHEMKPALPVIEALPAPPVRGLAPVLPEYARLTDAQLQLAAQGRGWLDAYIEWAHEGSPLTPDIFHEAIGVAALAMLSTRRVKLVLGSESIYPNLYVMLIGKSTIYRKSTAFKLAQRLIGLAGLNALIISGDATPEALFDEMAGVKPINYKDLPDSVRERWKLGQFFAAQRTIMKDEASSIFAAMKKDYNAGLTEILLQGYDGDSGVWEKIVKSRGLISVRDMCLSFLGATTPTMWGKYMGQEETENGFAARFALITPESIAPYQPASDNPPEPDALIRGLRAAWRVLDWDPRVRAATTEAAETYDHPVITASADHDALQAIQAYRRALGYDMIVGEQVGEDKSPFYGRLGTMMIKVALLFALVDAEEHGRVHVEARHAYAAQQLTERWRESLHRLDDAVARSHYEGKEDRVLSYLKGVGARGATLRELMKDCGLKDKKYATDIITLLADEGLIEKAQIDTGKPGRKPIVYRMAQEAEVKS